MCTLAGPNASVAFTHISSTAAAALPLAFADEVPRIARAEYHEQDVLALMQGLAHSSSDSDAGAFAWFLIGVRLPFPSFTAPTTLKTPSRVCLDHPAICFNTRESVEMPFHKPLLPPDMKARLDQSFEFCKTPPSSLLDDNH
ncbi:DUF431-domain-containing protein [Lactarius hengduanensis]|nr:DUF431-domain-containing protein [Lactarius hengduanensis]